MCLFLYIVIAASFQTRLRRIIWGSRIARGFLAGGNSIGCQVPSKEDCATERKVLYSPQEPSKASLFLICRESRRVHVEHCSVVWVSMKWIHGLSESCFGRHEFYSWSLIANENIRTELRILLYLTLINERVT